LVILLVVAAAMGVTTLRRGAPQTQPAISAQALPGLHASAAVRAGPGASSTPVPAAVTAIAAAPQGAASSPFVEVCGHGRVLRSELELAVDGPQPAWAEAMDRQLRLAQGDVLKRLDAGPPRQRVAAALLRQDVEAAAKIAATTDDAMAYHLALRACRKDASYRKVYAAHQARPPASAASGFRTFDPPAPGALPTACAALTLDRLEMLQPDDPWPWFARLNDGRNAGDEAAVRQALYQLAQRVRSAGSTRPLTRVLAEVVGAEPTMGETALLMEATSSDMVTHVDASLVSVVHACRPPQLADANRRQLCEQVTRRLPAMTTETMDAAMLRLLEKRLGLPAGAQSQGPDTPEGLRAMHEQHMAWTKEPSCTNFAHAGQHAVALARDGELAVARAWLKENTAASSPR
jgi:hypothetical protein